jgi:hypothetical protein
MAGKLRAIGALMFVVAMVGMSGGSASALQKQLPFQARYAGGAIADFAHGTVTFNGTGTSTYLGRSTNEGHIVTSALAPATQCPGGIGLPNVNTETLTAVGGDTLMLTLDDVACPLGGLQFHGIGHWTVTGGTGRFRDATGQGTADGLADFGLGTFSFTLTGEVVLSSR